MSPEDEVLAHVAVYRDGGLPALQERTGPGPVEAPVLWEAIRRLAVVTARGPQILAPLRERWAWEDFARGEATAEARAIARGGNR